MPIFPRVASANAYMQFEHGFTISRAQALAMNDAYTADSARLHSNRNWPIQFGIKSGQAMQIQFRLRNPFAAPQSSQYLRDRPGRTNDSSSPFSVASSQRIGSCMRFINHFALIAQATQGNGRRPGGRNDAAMRRDRDDIRQGRRNSSCLPDLGREFQANVLSPDLPLFFIITKLN
jgi:hypothetical protein